MSTDSLTFLETVTEISDDRRITQERIQNLLEGLGFDPESADYNVAMEDRVPPTAGEAMMSKRAEPHECRLIIDAIIRETLSHPALAVYSPKTEDMDQMGITPSEESDEIGRESTASLWLHMASEVSKAQWTLLVSPVIISITGSDSDNQHFHTQNFDQEDAQEIIDTITG
ncbi:hypothetical protein [Haloplanus aerogenes]|uniref:Uncharacterized protein n=1 Tax=Haloplanus aerogenes TaxID=660522 RepID=A0A3M0CWL9_9EURY|nr:hypothetical protein [Haloplanus aerogenes]AZH26708.1 hypothetical protein DU502_15575 [Haloplanus aerogenes]RMB12950.1 hypothetical protein ATH50_3106 [Haloplanus aerogenes]